MLQRMCRSVWLRPKRYAHVRTLADAKMYVRMYTVHVCAQAAMDLAAPAMSFVEALTAELELLNRAAA